MIHRLIGRSSLPAAYDVCPSWQVTLLRLHKSYFGDAHPCAPVQYGQRITIDNLSVTLDQEDIKEYANEVMHEAANYQGFTTLAYRPARIHQTPSFSAIARSAMEVIYHSFVPGNLFPLPISNGASQRHWLGLTQFEINTFFLDMFSTRIQREYGFLRLTLLSDNTPPTHPRTSTPVLFEI
jgi:hypothetical protein